MQGTDDAQRVIDAVVGEQDQRERRQAMGSTVCAERSCAAAPTKACAVLSSGCRAPGRRSVVTSERTGTHAVDRRRGRGLEPTRLFNGAISDPSTVRPATIFRAPNRHDTSASMELAGSCRLAVERTADTTAPPGFRFGLERFAQISRWRQAMPRHVIAHTGTWVGRMTGDWPRRL